MTGFELHISLLLEATTVPTVSQTLPLLRVLYSVDFIITGIKDQLIQVDFS